jgi:metal-dependent amidase/aminoacylase/carboxypeptidase family protein
MTLKNTFKKNLDSIHKQLTEVSDWMYENPELGFKEFKTSEYLVKFIESFR